jgi:hypothetical protein
MIIFFLFLQTKPSFCRLFVWSQLGFSATPVLISVTFIKSFSRKYVYFKIRDSILHTIFLTRHCSVITHCVGAGEGSNHKVQYLPTYVLSLYGRRMATSDTTSRRNWQNVNRGERGLCVKNLGSPKYCINTVCCLSHIFL